MVIIAFITIAFITYLFHEFGHWELGEILGNKMTLRLNGVTPQNGQFINKHHELWSAIGGPAFTITQALLALWITWKAKSSIAYSFGFFAVFMRFFGKAIRL
ncbi:hypothetical protein [uncultured Algibacter sp.]|uniref:hypothetical protein n=1 Tax=uncultured Algibacter sp. TaxID=298659 RepID=UPI0026260A3B|nr:hypothetical protein [uncultured Algibacter sp.]